MVDLITYLQEAVKNKSKINNKSTIKKKKLPRIPRRGLGFGMRHRNYKNYKDNKKDDTDKKLITLLTALFKSINPQNTLQQDKALNPFIEKEKQTYSMTFEPKVKTLEDRLKQVEQKQLTMGEVNTNQLFQEQKEIQLTTINNKLADYETKWDELLENQNSLIQEMNDIELGDMDTHIQDRFREENQGNKQDILGLQIELQQEINQENIDLNDYKSIIDFQNKVLDIGVNNFTTVDNRMNQELKEAKIGFENLQEETEKEKEKLKVKLKKNKNKVLELTSDLNILSTSHKKLKDKLQQYELSDKEPKRFEIKELDEEDEENEEEEFKPPSPKPKSPVERKITPEERWLINYTKGLGSLSEQRYKDIGSLFGENKINFYRNTKSGEVKRKNLKKLLIESGIDETLF